jgi:hypothetical protein
VYIECGGAKRVINSTTFLQDHYDLKWVTATENNASTIPNAIRIKHDAISDGFVIGRINLTLANSTKYTQVSKVHIDNGKSNLWYANSDQQGVPASGAFEVLTCNSPLLLKGGQTVIPPVDDGEKLGLTDQAFDTLGFTQEEKDNVYKITAAVMHMGAMAFKQRGR